MSDNMVSVCENCNNQWKSTAGYPLCSRLSGDYFEIIVEYPIEIAIMLRGAKDGPAENNIWYERYIASVSESGEMVDWDGNDIGRSWEDVTYWRSLADLP